MKAILELILRLMGHEVDREVERIRREWFRLAGAATVLLIGGMMLLGGMAAVILALCLMLMRGGMSGPGAALTCGIILLVLGGLVTAFAQRLAK